MTKHARAAIAATFFPSAAELATRRQFAQYLDADPATSPLLTATAAKYCLPAAQPTGHALRQAVAA